MPVTYQIDGANRLIHTKCIRPLTAAEVIDHFRLLEQDPSCPDRLDVLLEVRDGISVPSSGDLRAVTSAIGRVRGRVQFGICAIVAGTDVLYGMMRMFEVFAEQHFSKTRAFRTVREAEAWLSAQRSPATARTSAG
jgi:hypothetical protein